MGAGVVDRVQRAVDVEHRDRHFGFDADGFADGEVLESADGNHEAAPLCNAQLHVLSATECGSVGGAVKARKWEIVSCE
ncbi:hypothetical protein GCM10022380_39450 [Amycolatopsis tucumanensis]|uniref:Uncharacterized protein n=1 Tax=Amycolatopsis tucumanensis TaxID=401106 RepID=A0ABP7IFP5_9PSEU